MPSWVRVENLGNGRETTLRVNDRGPFAHGRILDVSRRAAQLLGMERAGVARVRVTRVYPDAAPQVAVRTARAEKGGAAIYLQVAALSDETRAHRFLYQLRAFGPAFVARSPEGLYRVRVGPYPSERAADQALAQLRRAGYVDAHIAADAAS